MKITRPFYTFNLALLLLFFTGCQTARPTYSFSPESQTRQAAPLPISSETVEAAKTPEPVRSFKPEKFSKTLPFQAEKVKPLHVKPLLAFGLSQTNVQAPPVSENIFSKKALTPKTLKNIKNIKDGPTEGPLRTLSGIFLGFGMALLLAALVILVLGTSGAGTLALIGGSSFLVGSILAIMALLKY